MKDLLLWLPIVFCFITEFGYASCYNIISGTNDKSRIATSSEALQDVFRDLAVMAVQNDTVFKQDASGLSVLLENDFNLKRAELRNLIVNLGLMTAEEFEAQLAMSVDRLQTQTNVSALTDPLSEQRQRELIKFAPVPDGLQALFGPIEGGLSVIEGGKVMIRVNSFAIMSTPVTEKIWNEVLRLAFIHFGSKYEFNLKKRQREVLGDRFARISVSWNDVQEWIEALNELSNLNVPALAELFPQHQKGDIYRLPTNAEWEFVARARGTLEGDYSVPLDEMDEYISPREKNSFQREAVARKKPFMVGTTEIYDLFGHVGQLTLNTTSHPNLDVLMVSSRGGSYKELKEQLRIAFFAGHAQTNSSATTGFRLLRERMK